MLRPPNAHTLLLLLIAGATVAGCGLPRDPDGTTKRLRGGGELRVGVAANPPWVVDSAGAVGGIEGAFVAELAHELGARPVWVRGAESELLAALKERELDLVIAGLSDAVPWKQEVALTRPYYTDTIVVGVMAGETARTELEGQQIAVDARSPELAALVRKKGATPHLVADLNRASGVVAAPSWRLPALRRRQSGEPLQEVAHVLAASPGENDWLVRVERLLRARQSAVPAALRAEAP